MTESSEEVVETVESVRDRLGERVRSGDVEGIRALLEDVHSSDIADLVEGLEEPEHRLLVLRSLPVEDASETLSEMEEGDFRASLLAALTPEIGAELLHEMADDDAADLIAELDPRDRSRILSSLPIDEAGDLQGLLIYGEETAGGRMTTSFVALEGTTTAAEAIEGVRRRGREVEDFYT
ncbi:MAG: magnesium transporter MgtE N-terminal domain-containing protein, partial [Gemmatimonadota bacterium]